MRHPRGAGHFLYEQSDANSMNAPSFLRAIIPDWRIILPAAVLGTIAGALLYWALVSPEAIVVIQSGRVGGL
jgi:hypothetical protein